MVPQSYEVQVVHTAPRFFTVEDARFCPGGGFVVMELAPDATSRLLYCKPDGRVLEISRFSSDVAAEIRSVGQGYVVVAKGCFAESWRAMSAYSLETSAMLVEVRLKRYETGLTLNLETGSCVLVGRHSSGLIFKERNSRGERILGQLLLDDVNQVGIMPGEKGELLVGIHIDYDRLLQWLYLDTSSDRFCEIIREGLDHLPSVTACPLFSKGEPRVFPGFISVVDGLDLESHLTIWDVKLSARHDLVDEHIVYFPSARVIRQGEGGWISVAGVSAYGGTAHDGPHIEAYHVFDSHFNITKVDREQLGKSLSLGGPTDLTPEGNVLFSGVQDRIPVAVLLVAK